MSAGTTHRHLVLATPGPAGLAHAPATGRERETLGWYLSGHPTEEDRLLLEQLVGTSLVPPTACCARASSAASRGAGRMVTDIRKRGDNSQGFVSLED